MTWAAAGALLRRLWPAIPITLLAVALLVTRSKLADVRHTLDNERSAWTAEVARADAMKNKLEREYALRTAEAATSYADRLAAREPIILRSTDTVRTYAQTDAGRARCLGADRVRGIDALDAALFADPSAATDGGAVAVPAESDDPPAGR